MLLVLLTPAGDAGKKGESTSLGLAVQVVYGEEVGSESLREQVELTIVRAIEQGQCYRLVERYDTDQQLEADVALRVGIHNLEVREDYEASIAERTSPRTGGDPNLQRRVVATIAFDVRLEMFALPEAVLVRSRAYHHEEGYRPQHTEDARYEVRRKVIQELARDVRSFACKSAKKLPREIARARADGPN